jgi:hypothetical protein
VTCLIQPDASYFYLAHMPTVLILSVGGNNSFIAVTANAGDEVVYFRTEKGKDAIAYRGHCYRLDH